jgi:Spy/CpxP family protein refolding chaperone
MNVSTVEPCKRRREPMKRVGAGIGFVLITGLAAATALAADPPPRDEAAQRRAARWAEGAGMGGFGMGEVTLKRLVEPEIAAKLNLSADQVSSLKKLAADTENEATGLTAELKKAGEKQAQLMSANTTDEAAIMAAVEETGAIRTKIAKVRVRQLLGTKRILTADQQKAAREMFRQRMNERRPDRERRGPPPPATATPLPQTPAPAAEPAK